eukprot:scaffold993_cov393-Prasinococcus_capsulatus_cf.AAC.4
MGTLNARPRPRSPTFTMSLLTSINKFCGFKSLCSTPWLCMSAHPLHSINLAQTKRCQSAGGPRTGPKRWCTYMCLLISSSGAGREAPRLLETQNF